MVAHTDPVTTAFEAVADALPLSGVHIDLETVRQGRSDPKQALLAAPGRVHAIGRIPSHKMGRAGVSKLCSARNGGSSTLEAEPSTSPDGYTVPGFTEWEVKQYGRRDFTEYVAKSPVMLMIPEPTGGICRDEGVEVFLRRFSDSDKAGKANRINFDGIYTTDQDFYADTELRMTGFDAVTGKITDVGAAIRLVDRDGAITASGGFKGIMAHWNELFPIVGDSVIRRCSEVS